MGSRPSGLWNIQTKPQRKAVVELWRLPLPALMVVGTSFYRHLGSCKQPAVAGGGLSGGPTPYLAPFRTDANFGPLPTPLVTFPFGTSSFSGSEDSEGIKSNPCQRKICLTYAASINSRNVLMIVGTTTPDLWRGPVISLSPNNLKSFISVF